MQREERTLFLLFFLLVFPVFGAECLRIVIPSFPAHLNPVYASDETSQAVLNKVHQALFAFDGQGQLVNELAEEVVPVAAGPGVEIRLRRGVFFSTGRELQARDVVATIALLRDPAYGYPYRSDLEWLKSAAVIDPRRLRLDFHRPFAPWRTYLTFKVLDAAEIGNWTAAQFRDAVPAGCGWYRFAQIDAPSGLRLERNRNRPKAGLFPELAYEVLLDMRQAPLKLLAGETDAAELLSEDIQTYERVPSWQKCFRLARFRKAGYLYLVFNLRRAAISLPLRQTIYERIVRGPFLERFLAGAGQKVASPFLYLTEARVPRFVAPAGHAAFAPLTILCNAETPLRRNLVLFMCQELQRSGIELTPRFLEYQTFLAELKAGRFDLAVSGFLLDLDWNLGDVLASTGVVNYAGYADAEMDRLLSAGLTEMDEARRRDLYVQAHDRWARSLPLIPLFSTFSAMALSHRVRVPAAAFRLLGSTGDFFYNIQEWRR